jgi:uncharacterized membrane protein
MIILVMLAILVVPYLVLTAVGAARPDLAVDPQVRGRVGLALMFLFTASGHIVKPRAMSEMLPPWVPGRVAIIYMTGVLEIAGAIGLLMSQTHRLAGLCLLLFLIAVLPANIYAAFSRADMGGHAQGPRYLLARVPLQLVLMGWTYWFAVR